MKWLIIIPFIAIIIMYLLTDNQPLVYATKATLFTAIASGSTLSNLDNSRVDFFASKTAYNNLITIINSRKVVEETSLRLLAKHLMLQVPDPGILSANLFEELNENLPIEIKEMVDYGDEETTYNNLNTYISQDKSNYLYGLLNYDHPNYSHKAISSIKTKQVDGSDIIELSYASNDPAVAYHTLEILINVFLKEYGSLKINQASAVIAYFEKQLDNASLKLNDAEDKLLEFNKKNQIINYYEQTKHISSQQEKIEIKLYDIILEYEAAEAILSKLEIETQSRFNINLKNKEIIDLRELLIVVNKNLASLAMKSGDINQPSKLKQKLVGDKFKLEQKLQYKLDSLYIYERKSDGIAIESLLNDWLKNVMRFESAKARLLTMQSKSKEFNLLYNQFAPLGASLKRIEREIEVKEKAYLEILHHLGLARLKQQNEEMMANMKILDRPFMPIDSEPTKRKIIVLAIGLFTFLFTLLGFFAINMLERTIKTPTRLQDFSGYQVKGTLPLQTNHKLNWELLSYKGLKIITEVVRNKMLEKDDPKPIVIQVLSHLQGEGKSHVVNQLYNIFSEQDYKVHKMYFHLNGDKYYNEASQLCIQNQDISDYFSAYPENNNSDIIIIEVPALADHGNHISPTLLKTSDVNLLVVDASRTWSKYDDIIKTHFHEQTNIIPSVILNKTLPEDMVDLIGEIPMQRSKIRSFIKNQIVKKYIS